MKDPNAGFELTSMRIGLVRPHWSGGGVSDNIVSLSRDKSMFAIMSTVAMLLLFSACVCV